MLIGPVAHLFFATWLCSCSAQRVGWSDKREAADWPGKCGGPTAVGSGMNGLRKDSFMIRRLWENVWAAFGPKFALPSIWHFKNMWRRWLLKVSNHKQNLAAPEGHHFYTPDVGLCLTFVLTCALKFPVSNRGSDVYMSSHLEPRLTGLRKNVLWLTVHFIVTFFCVACDWSSCCWYSMFSKFETWR